MNLVCKGAVNVGSKIKDAVDLAKGSSREALFELIILPDGGVEGW